MKIKFKIEKVGIKYRSITPCPHGVDVYVGSVGCACCRYHGGVGKKNELECRKEGG